MLSIDPTAIPVPDLHQYLVSAVAPRPIAFASTVSEEGLPNLAPYSFFNIFSSNPPICIFSSNRRVSNNTTKDTLHNVRATGEVVINIVSYPIVRQMALASIEFAPEVNEFEQSGLTPIPSDMVKPFRVKEALVQLECKVEQILPLGTEGGAGHLIICHIVRMHISEDILDERGRIDPHKLDLMGRMGRAFYVRASGDAIHQIYQPMNVLGIGFPVLPATARHSSVLTGNDLGQLAAIAAPPTAEDIGGCRGEARVQAILADAGTARAELHRYAQKELAKNEVAHAAALVWLAEEIE